MPLTPGTSLGPYQIDAPLGAGGMGEVYKATDTRLDRTVAIKVLPEHVANDPDLKQRFEREARTVAALNHPHICTLHDIGNQDGIDFLVMEYLDGETLAQRLEKGALPLDQALTIATEIADALDKAHRQGIVHRDLKPGNIMLTKTGAKLLDFGLAKLRKPGTVGATGFSAAATQTEPLTGQGMILGTLQYMAPEQVEGKDADARTDIFAFGAVVYEMVTGQKAFEGDSQASLITSIMSATPTPPSALQPVSPPSLDRVVTKCLAKDPDARWQTARDLRDELTWITDGGSHVGVPAVVATPRKTRERLWMATAALATLVATALAALYLNRAPAEGVTTRLSVLPEPGGMLGLALSPDGTQLAFVTGQLRGQLWVRPVDSLDARPLPGADNAAYPFWSPDGRTIGFFTLDELKTVDLTGGLPRTVCPVPTGAGGTWNQDDVIVFGQLTGSLHQVAAAGGEPIPLTALDVPGAASYLWPQFLSAGERVLFLAVAPEEQESGIYIGSLASGRTPTRVMQTATMARFTAPGYLLFGQDGALMAQSFELERLSVTGDPLRVAEELLPGSVGTQRLRFSTSDQGGLAYVGGGGSAQSQLRWVDRAGTELSTVGAPGDYYSPVLSPDENRIAVERDGDIWLLELARGTDQRFTFAPEDDRWPIWSPDGERLVFASYRDGLLPDLYEKRTAGTSAAHLLLETDFAKFPSGWSADGAFVSYTELRDSFDLWLLPMSGDRQPTSYLRTPFQDTQGLPSPDGRWMAYTSDESGESRVYMRRAPPSGGQWQVSTGEGGYPRWRADGRELYYVTPDNRLMAVDIEAAGDTPVVGIPQPLFQVPFSRSSFPRNVFDVTTDGQRFLVNTFVEGALGAPITWVLNWTAELEP